MLKKEKVLKQKKFTYAFYSCNQSVKITLNLIEVLNFNVIFLIKIFFNKYRGCLNQFPTHVE